MNLAYLALVQAALLAATPVATPTPLSYKSAHQQMVETGRPIVVLVGAEWCPACRVMKNTAVPQAQQRGVLDRVAFATVNTDHEAELAKELTGGGSIPQLVMYHRTAAGWQRRVLVGAQSPTAIEGFINQGLTSPASSTLGRN